MTLEEFKVRKREGSLPKFVRTSKGFHVFIDAAGAMRRAARLVKKWRDKK